MLGHMLPAHPLALLLAAYVLLWLYFTFLILFRMERFNSNALQIQFFQLLYGAVAVMRMSDVSLAQGTPSLPVWAGLFGICPLATYWIIRNQVTNWNPFPEPKDEP